MNQVQTGWPYELGAEDPFATPPPHVPPCPLCSGRVSRDDPAAQALDWAVTMAEAREGESDFWKVAQAAETYRRSGQADDGEISAFVDGVTGALSDAAWLELEPLPEVVDPYESDHPPTDGTPGTTADFPDIPDVPIPPDPPEPVLPRGYPLGLSDAEKRALNEVPVVESEDGHNKVPPEGSTQSFPWMKGPGCCIKDFQYPVPGSLLYVPVSGAPFDKQDVGVGFQFNAQVEFWPQSADRPHCHCLCCVFRQYKKFHHVVGGQVMTSHPTYVEDTRTLPSGKIRSYGGSRAADPARDDPSTEVPSGGNEYTSDCVFKMQDSPKVRQALDPGDTYNLTWDDLARVHDRCKGMIPVITARLLLFRAGKIGEVNIGTPQNPEMVDIVDDEDSGATHAPGQSPTDAWTGASGRGSKSMPGEKLL